MRQFCRGYCIKEINILLKKNLQKKYTESVYFKLSPNFFFAKRIITLQIIFKDTGIVVIFS